MKFRSIFAGTTALLFILTSSSLFHIQAAQEGPQSQSSDSVAKPKKKPQPQEDNGASPAEPEPEPENKPIPSEFKKPKDVPADTPPSGPIRRP